MFPNVPPDGRRRLKETIATWFTVGYTRMWILVPLAAIGLALGLLSEERPKASVVLLGVTVLYFAVVPAATQWPEERYRLPIDPLLFVFALLAYSNSQSEFAR